MIQWTKDDRKTGVRSKKEAASLKFRNGDWLLRRGVTATYANGIRETKHEAGVFTLFTTPYPSPDRTAVGGSMLQTEFFSPAENVLGVRLTHFRGVRKTGPEFGLSSDGTVLDVSETGDAYILRAGKLRAVVKKPPQTPARGDVWDLSFYGGEKLLTSSGARSAAYYQDAENGRNYVSQELDLAPEETVYGLGERFGPLVRNGQSVDMWQADGGAGSEQAYKNVPFYYSNRGYGLFVNTPADASFEIQTERVERLTFSAEGESLEYYVIWGETPAEVYERYTFLTGRPALPPEWSFGLWLSTSFLTDYDEKTVTGFIDGMAARDIPLSVFHFDCYWMKGNHWVDFTWDPAIFPDPKAMLARYKARGLRICVWINPYVAQMSREFDEAARKGYLLMKENGDVWQTDLWQSGMGIVDFTNPAARAWYRGKLRELMDMGVDCFKTDFGERIPVRGIRYFDGSDPVKMHNYYTYLYNECVFGAVEEYRGKGDAVVFARSGTAGGQRFPVHWGGDNAANYRSMAGTLRAGLSLGMSGYGFWSHDISGFEATATPDLYKRWCAFGLLSSHSRLHGSGSYRVPWNFDGESSEVLRFFVRQKCRLMPYLYGEAVKAHRVGTPMLRPLIFDFPNDPAVPYLDKEYMLGESLLVAPVFREDGRVRFYVPEGVWTDYISGKKYPGGRWYEEKYDYFSLPLLVKPGAVLPEGAVETRPDYDYTAGLTLRLYEIAEGTRTVTRIPDEKGETAAEITVEKKDGTVTVTPDRPLFGLKAVYDGKEFPVSGKTALI